MVRDRAAVITRTVREITSASSIPETERWFHVEKFLRDEIDAIGRDAMADRRIDGDA